MRDGRSCERLIRKGNGDGKAKVSRTVLIFGAIQSATRTSLQGGATTRKHSFVDFYAISVTLVSNSNESLIEDENTSLSTRCGQREVVLAETALWINLSAPTSGA